MKSQDTLFLIFSSLSLAAPSSDRRPPQKSAPDFQGSSREGQQGVGGGRIRRGGNGSFVEFYDRFGALCPGEFITKYWDHNALPTPYWHFPGFEGFSLNTNGDPITGTLKLDVGVLVDRFGGESGRFVSPAVAPYIQRALPPNNLDTPQDNPQVPYGYHLYRVAKTFNVEAGPIAPWFEQPGQGVQYHLPDSKTVKQLIDSGHLVAEDPFELYSPGRDN